MLKQLLLAALDDKQSLEEIVIKCPNLKNEIIQEYINIFKKKLRNYQTNAINDMREWFKNNNIYNLFWCCGLGKSIIGIEYFCKNKLNSLCICVPSIILIEQFEEYLSHYLPLVPIFKLCCEKDKDDLSFVPNDISELHKYLLSDLEYKIILTTYHSTKKLVKFCCDFEISAKTKALDLMDKNNNIKFEFDLTIFDESHHLVDKKSKLFSYSLLIPSKKKLFQTATPYIGETKMKYCLETSVPFKGKINRKSLYFGIDNGYISDYRLIILKYNFELINDKFNRFEHKSLLISCLMALKSIYNNLNNKILIYCNKIKNSKIIKTYLDELIVKYNGIISDINPRGLTYNIFNNEINGSDHDRSLRNKMLEDFRNSEKGILSSVQLFGEGFDYRELEGVLFAEKMNSSVRIIQSGLRACRIDPNNPDKIANIMIPIFDEDNDLSSIKQVLQEFKRIDIKLPNKLTVTNYNKFDKLFIQEFNHRELDLSDDIRKLYEKIEFKYLEDFVKDRKIDNRHLFNININNIKNILLTPVSEGQSFKNFYKAVLTREYDDGFWGFKLGKNGCILKLYDTLYCDELENNDLLCFVEKDMLTIVQLNYKKKSKEFGKKMWNDELFELIVNFRLIMRIQKNKKDLMEQLGYSRKFPLQGSIFAKKQEIIYGLVNDKFLVQKLDKVQKAYITSKIPLNTNTKKIDQSIKKNDIVFLKVKGKHLNNQKDIYCNVDKVNEKSIKVTDITEKKEKEDYNYYLQPDNPISRNFGNSYNKTRNIQICIRD